MDIASLTQSLGLPEMTAGNVLAGGFILTAATYIFTQIRGVFSPIFNYYISKCTTFVELKDNHPTYYFTALALSKKIDSKRGRFKVECTENTAYGVSVERKNSWYLLPGYGLHIVKVGGALCFVRFMVRNLEQKDENSGKSYEETISMWFPFANNSVIYKVVEEGEKLYKEFHAKSTDIERFIARRDYWDNAGTIKYRNIDNIILPTQQKSTILNAIEDFLGNKEWFAARNLAYKTGFLFYGPPGTGKTSIIGALSYKYKMPIYSLSLSGASCSDEELITLIRQIPEKSILLFEDIDKIDISKKEDKKPKESLSKITLSGLLNALDGINSGEGFITIMTANNPELIDPALLRPGRIDQKILFDNPKADLIVRFIRKFYGLEESENCDLNKLSKEIESLGWSMAALQSYCLSYRNSVEDILSLDNLENFDENLNLNTLSSKQIDVGSTKKLRLNQVLGKF